MLSTWRPGWASLVHRMQSSRMLTPLRSRRLDMPLQFGGTQHLPSVFFSCLYRRALLAAYPSLPPHSINICLPYLIHILLYLYLYCALSLSRVCRGIIFALEGAGIVYGSLPCAAGSVRATTMQAVHAAWLSMWTCENAWQLVFVHAPLSPNPSRSAQVCVCARAGA